MNLTPVETRIPAEVRSPRMGALARLPVFLALQGRRVVIAGGSPAAVWKVELLRAAGANVDVYAAEPSAELLAVVQEAQRGMLTLHRRDWRPADCTGAAIAVGAFEDDTAAGRFARPRTRWMLACAKSKASVHLVPDRTTFGIL